MRSVGNNLPQFTRVSLAVIFVGLGVAVAIYTTRKDRFFLYDFAFTWLPQTAVLCIALLCKASRDHWGEWLLPWRCTCSFSTSGSQTPWVGFSTYSAFPASSSGHCLAFFSAIRGRCSRRWRRLRGWFSVSWEIWRFSLSRSNKTPCGHGQYEMCQPSHTEVAVLKTRTLTNIPQGHTTGVRRSFYSRS